MLVIGRPTTTVVRRLTAARTTRCAPRDTFTRACSTFRGTSTAAIHADALEDDAFGTSKDVAPPLSLSTTFTCPEPGGSGHVYSRISSPTRERCEALLGAIEKAIETKRPHCASTAQTNREARITHHSRITHESLTNHDSRITRPLYGSH